MNVFATKRSSFVFGLTAKNTKARTAFSFDLLPSSYGVPEVATDSREGIESRRFIFGVPRLAHLASQRYMSRMFILIVIRARGRRHSRCGVVCTPGHDPQ